MKTFKEFIDESEVPSNTTSGIADPESSIGKVQKQKYLGYDCFELDEETYHKCVGGKVPFSRWDKLISDESLREEMKNAYHKSKRLVVKSGDKATFIK